VVNDVPTGGFMIFEPRDPNPPPKGSRALPVAVATQALVPHKLKFAAIARPHKLPG
jgi:hypothetical protein